MQCAFKTFSFSSELYIIGYAINKNGSLEGVPRKFFINHAPLLVGTRFCTYVVQRTRSAFGKHSDSHLRRPSKCPEPICKRGEKQCGTA